MKSIKRGRGPSFMGGVASLAAALFGVFWMIMAASIGAPGLFVAMGGIFVVVAVVSAVYEFTNATAKKRFSEFDVVTDEEEGDILNEYFGENGAGHMPEREKADIAFCPWCGEEVAESYRFCPRCGKALDKGEA